MSDRQWAKARTFPLSIFATDDELHRFRLEKATFHLKRNNHWSKRFFARRPEYKELALHGDGPW